MNLRKTLSVAALALAAPTPVLPVFFSVRNSMIFQLCASLSRRARLLLLAREMIHQRDSTARLRIGEPVGIADLQQAGSPDALIDRLRASTYALANLFADLLYATLDKRIQYD